jgi:hypothetical protein
MIFYDIELSLPKDLGKTQIGIAAATVSLISVSAMANQASG